MLRKIDPRSFSATSVTQSMETEDKAVQVNTMKVLCTAVERSRDLLIFVLFSRHSSDEPQRFPNFFFCRTFEKS
jgi:hypothetical protein